MERAAEACRLGNLEYISTLGDDLQRLIDRVDEDGRSLLHSAASSGCAPLLDFLAEEGAGPMVNRQDEEVRGRQGWHVTADGFQATRHLSQGGR